MVKKYSEIEKIEKNGIIFSDGTRIQFDECMEKCIAERDVTATPPTFVFFTGDKIIFDKKDCFHKVRM